MPNKKKRTNAQILKAIKGSYGINKVIYNRLRISRSTLAKYLNKNQEIREAVEQEKEESLDNSEIKLHEGIEDGSESLLMFHLKCKGKARGYIEKEVINNNIEVNPVKLILPSELDAETWENQK